MGKGQPKDENDKYCNLEIKDTERGREPKRGEFDRETK